MALTRRGVLAGSAAGGLLLAAGPAGAKTNMVFAHGVASGDPHADSVLLWTRVTDPAHGPVSGTWEMAEDELFTRIAARGSFSTSAARDHTVKVIASGLKAGREYFYRFRAMDVNRRPKRTPYRRAKGTPFVEQRDGYDGRFVRAGCGVGRA
ncbi:PhoD-like phosphatase N-terminal domain-containing protein [Sphingomonas adhaesiva]|uniref:Phospholipase D N-terminal domain-containing protein n=2 Tax=Sphingomonas TaxID=13687 RepID=A0A2A4I3R9_9SPHN|nr:PhoD-like phosphatase N-terminal domain-containing protein [Sphingomonas adhaesiva]PCG13125.1 hypothetical protein COA07_16100 [Sphingomonas adhaesiva]